MNDNNLEKDNFKKSFADHMNPTTNNFTTTVKSHSTVKQPFSFVLEAAIENKVHLGSKQVSQDMQRFMFTDNSIKSHDSSIIDLDITKDILNDLFIHIEKIIGGGDNILLACPTQSVELKKIIETFANNASIPYITNRILPGLLTNSKQVMVDGLKRMENDAMLLKENKFANSAEKSKTKHNYEAAEKNMIGFKNLANKKIKAIIVIAGSKGADSVLAEARRKNIITIVLCDLNAKTKNADYIIPCNTTSNLSVSYILDMLLPSFANGHLVNSENIRSSNAFVKKEYNRYDNNRYDNNRYDNNKTFAKKS